MILKSMMHYLSHLAMTFSGYIWLTNQKQKDVY